MRKTIERFWAKVNKTEGGCWEWTGAKARGGYGTLNSAKAGGCVGAHRFSFWLHNGIIDPLLMVLHSCDNPGCVNPGHLRQGTAQDNMDDKVRAGNAAVKLTEEQVLAIRKDDRVQRVIAEDYGVSTSMVSYIKRGEYWSHLN